MKIVEQWGSGIAKSLKECRKFGLVKPEFVEYSVDFRVNLYRNQIANGAIGTNGTNRGTKNTNLDELNEGTGKLLSLLLENPKITQTELRARLKVSLRTIKCMIADLKEAGILTQEGSVRSGNWIVRKQ